MCPYMEQKKQKDFLHWMSNQIFHENLNRILESHWK